jgi:hypothetical protein
MANSRMLEIVVGLGLGAYFLAKGVLVWPTKPARL